jgi:D-glycero-alpha-D-manno-heptose-7-phosphate kinase
LIITRSPLRITLGGGGTDVPFFFERHGGNFISASINKHVYVSINQINEEKFILRYSKLESASNIKEIQHPIIREALKYFKITPGVEITSFADIKSGTGLGSSGAFTVALIQALSIYKNNKKLSKKELSKIASYIEIDVLKEPVGIQDPHASSYGSIQYFKISKNGLVKNYDIYKDNVGLKNFVKDLYLINTKKRRNASKELSRTIFNHDSKKEIFDNLLKSKESGIEAYNFLTDKKKVINFGNKLFEQWRIKYERSPSKFHSEINNMINELINLGCTGSKLIGAGGGGYILIHCPKSYIKKVESYINKNKLNLLNFEIDTEGTTYFEL